MARNNVIEFRLDALDRASRKINNVGTAFKRMAAVAVAALATISFTNTIRGLTNVGIALEGVETAMQAVAGSAEAAANELAFVRQEADRLGLDFLDLSDSMIKLIASSRGTGLQMDDVRSIFTATATAMRVLNRTNEQTRGAFVAIEQIISKGRVSSEELRQQLAERLPGAFNIAAAAMGVTTGRLNEMLEQGLIPAAEFLPKFAAELQRRFAGGVELAADTLQARLARLRNSFRDVQIALARGGLLDALADTAEWLSMRLPPAIAHLMRWWRGFIGVIQLVRAELLELVIDFNSLFKVDENNAVQRFFESIEENARETGGAAAKAFEVLAGTINSAFLRANDTQRDLVLRQEELRQAAARNFEFFEGGWKDFVQNVDDARDSLIDLGDGFADASIRMRRMIAETKKIYDQTRTPLERFRANVARAVELFQQVGFEGGADTLRRYIEQEWQAVLDATEEATDTLTVFAEQAARNMQDAFADFLFDPFEDGLRGMLASFVDILRRMVAEALAARIFQSLGIASLLAGNPAGAAAALGGSRQGGGAVRPGVAYRVHKDETIVPGFRGNVMPAGAGGGGITINWNIDARGATRELLASLPTILERSERRTIAKVAQLQRQGGGIL